MTVWLPVIVALLGIAGTLSAALFTQRAAASAEAQRREATERDRWLVERLRVARSVLAVAEAIERQLYSDCSFLTAKPGPRETWLDGHLNVLSTPEEGIEGVITAETREILVESMFEWTPKFDELSLLEAEVRLIGFPEEEALAEDLVDALLVARSNVEAFAPPDQAYAAIVEARELRLDYIKAARSSLRVDPEDLARQTAERANRRSQLLARVYQRRPMRGPRRRRSLPRASSPD